MVSLVPLLLAPAVALDRYRALGHLVGNGFLVTQFDSLARRRNVPLASAQAVRLMSSATPGLLDEFTARRGG